MVKLATFSWMLKSDQYPMVEWKQRELVIFLFEKWPTKWSVPQEKS